MVFPSIPMDAHTIITEMAYMTLIKAWMGKDPRCFTVWNQEPHKNVTKIIPIRATCGVKLYPPLSPGRKSARRMPESFLPLLHNADGGYLLRLE